MKLRTVLNELECREVRSSRKGLLDEDVLLTPEYDMNVPPEARLCRLCRYEDYAQGSVAPGPKQVLLVYAGHKIPDDARAAGDALIVSHKSGYDDFRMSFLDLPAKCAVLELRRDRMFDAFLASYDLTQFAKRSSMVLGNPVIIANADMRVLATAGEFPEDAPDVQEVLSQGYVSEEVNNEMESDGTIAAVRHARHSLISGNLRYGRRWVTSIIYYHHLEMGRYDVLEKDRPITGFDLELVDYAAQLSGIMIDRLGAAGERVGAGSSVLSDLVDGTFVNEETMRAQVLLTNLTLDVSYVLAVIQGQRNADREYHARIGTMAARSIRNCLWCAREDCLIVLVPIGKNETAGYDDYARAQRRLQGNKAFTGMLANNELDAYVSEPFRDLTRCPGRLKEARDLAGVAKGEKSGKVYYFWEHRFAALASVQGSLDRLEMMLDKRVVAMADYDREHGTAYLQTAIMSVRFPGSPAEAAAALNVHRNTYFYRMNKVRELFFIDLKDGDDRLALSFSASIMEGMNR